MAETTYLVVRHVRPDGDIDTYRLRSGRSYQLGRGSTAHLRVLDPRLSRHHATFECRDGVWQIGDAGSTNGIHIDDQPVHGWANVVPGARITAGDTLLIADSIIDPDRDGDSPSAQVAIDTGSDGAKYQRRSGS